MKQEHQKEEKKQIGTKGRIKPKYVGIKQPNFLEIDNGYIPACLHKKYNEIFRIMRKTLCIGCPNLIELEDKEKGIKVQICKKYKPGNYNEWINKYTEIKKLNIKND